MNVPYICVSPDPDALPEAGQDLVDEARELGFQNLIDLYPSRVYWFSPDASEHLETIAEDFLLDPIVQNYRLNDVPDSPYPNNDRSLVVRRKPGVMDPEALSALEALRNLDLPVQKLRTGWQYWINGEFAREELLDFGRSVLANEVIENMTIGKPDLESFPEPEPYSFNRVTFPMRDASPETMEQWNRENTWSLNDRELNAIQSYFQEEEKRNPTDLELETIAQTWSEHCKHKTLTGKITYGDEEIDNLLKETIMKATEEVGEDWCLTVFDDNAGIVDFTDDWGISFKVETHNHPSAIEPYGGAGTGIGGVIRDILGAGLGATPIMNTDVFCVAPPDYERSALPENVIHPRRVLKGVVSGVRDYGNRMGIPTASGSVCFDHRYLGNPLVFCGTVGRIPKNRIEKEPRPGDRIIAVGGRTGRDGIHGATFSSAELETETAETAGTAVQIGNAITEKRMMEAIIRAREENLYTCITDCGAGGFSSAVGETAEETGAEVHLENALLKYEGLRYDEIWISESQERMVLAVPESNRDRLYEICEEEGVEACDIGRYTDTERLVVKYEGETVGNLEMEFLHHGLPDHGKEAIRIEPNREPTDTPAPDDFEEALTDLLSALNVCSKHWIIRQYDHEVQGRTMLKPLVGEQMDGPGDATVIQPLPSSTKGLAVGCGISPNSGDLDPYRMAANGIDEAIRNVVATGANPDRIALLDNFAWGSPERPELLGKLVEAAKACRDVAIDYETPFVSGKDSLYNEFEGEEETLIIPPTLLISAAGQVPDFRKAMSMDFKTPGNPVYLIGETREEMGGSEYARLLDEELHPVPEVHTEQGKRIFQTIHKLSKKEVLKACHDISDGGLACTLAESAFAGGIGFRGTINSDLTDMSTTGFLFSQSPSRFLVEVAAEEEKGFQQITEDVPVTKLGTTTTKKRLLLNDGDGAPIINQPLAELKAAWQEPLDWE